jgi:hypothetical protein
MILNGSFTTNIYMDLMGQGYTTSPIAHALMTFHLTHLNSEKERNPYGLCLEKLHIEVIPKCRSYKLE